MDIKAICKAAPVIPVITIDDPDTALPLAEALVSGGLPVLEITLRSPAAVDAIRRIAREVEGAIVGAGTLRSGADIDRVIDAGALFGVSPGTPAALIRAVQQTALPFLPGCATPSEAMNLAERGFPILKFFPAAAAGGVAMLKSIAAPLPDLKFCPTGGIDLSSAPAYLALDNVVTVGGSWITPEKYVLSKDWAGIRQLALQTVQTLKS